MIQTTLVAGGTAAEREQAIAAVLVHSERSALILEGMPDGTTLIEASDHVAIARISAGCPCCEGNLILRVTLNRMIRQQPARLFIGLAAGTHVQALHAFLAQPPYSNFLALTKDLALADRTQQ